MPEDRGRLLFRVSSEKRLQFYLRIVLVIVAALYALDAYQEHRLTWLRTLTLATYVIVIGTLTFQKVSFYENGIHFPRERSGAAARFVPWQQIERFHWDGELLTVVPASSLLAGSAGVPLSGGTVHVPPTYRTEVVSRLPAIPKLPG